MKRIVFNLTLMWAAGSASLLMAAPGSQGDTAAVTRPGSQAPVLLSGKLTSAGGSYFLTDENTRITFEVRGADLKRYAGKEVKLQGQVLQGKAAAGASQVFEVSRIMRGAVAGTAMSGRAAAAGVKTGMSKAAVLGTIGGTAAAGTVGGLYASGAIGGEDSAVSKP